MSLSMRTCEQIVFFATKPRIEVVMLRISSSLKSTEYSLPVARTH
jgi:hypothetical protein